jgi:hypothetical protein
VPDGCRSISRSSASARWSSSRLGRQSWQDRGTSAYLREPLMSQRLTGWACCFTERFSTPSVSSSGSTSRRNWALRLASIHGSVFAQLSGTGCAVHPRCHRAHSAAPRTRIRQDVHRPWFHGWPWPTITRRSTGRDVMAEGGPNCSVVCPARDMARLFPSTLGSVEGHRVLSDEPRSSWYGGGRRGSSGWCCA